MGQSIAIVGGTGPEGRALATRLARAGHDVAIGSREAERGRATAGELAAMLEEAPGGRVTGGANEEVVRDAAIVVIAVPYAGHRPTLEALRPALEGKIVIDAVVPLRFERGPWAIDVAEGSAAEEAAAVLGPGSRVAGAFHNLSAGLLADGDAPLDADIFVTADDEATRRAVMALAEEIPGIRAVDAGPLRYSRFVEQLTVLLIGINGRYRTQSHVRVIGIDR